MTTTDTECTAEAVAHLPCAIEDALIAVAAAGAILEYGHECTNGRRDGPDAGIRVSIRGRPPARGSAVFHLVERYNWDAVGRRFGALVEEAAGNAPSFSRNTHIRRWWRRISPSTSSGRRSRQVSYWKTIHNISEEPAVSSPDRRAMGDHCM